MNIKGQGHYLTFHKGHFIFKLKFCFSQKLLGYLKPNIMWKLLRVVKEKIYTTDVGHMTKMAATPIYSKHI